MEDIDLRSFWYKKNFVSYVLSVLVLLIHVSSLGYYMHTSNQEINNFNSWLSSFFNHSLNAGAVPGFFVISGALFFRNYSPEKYMEKLKSRVYTLVIPYLLWNTINTLFAIVTSYTFISNYFVGREKFVITPLNLFLAIFRHKCYGAFWFIYDLILFTVLSPLIYTLIYNRKRAWCSFFTLFVIHSAGLEFPDWMVLRTDACVFYLFGCIVGKYYFTYFSKRLAKKRAQFACLICVLLSIFFTIKWQYQLPIPRTVDTPLCLAVALFIWCAADLIDPKPNSLYKGSFFVYAMHGNIQAIFSKVLSFIIPQTTWGGWVNKPCPNCVPNANVY